MNTVKNECSLRFGRFGLAEDPRHLHCAIQFKGRTYLGEIMGAEFNDVRNVTLLNVRHFNGELWPFQPHAASVRILQ